MNRRGALAYAMPLLCAARAHTHTFESVRAAEVGTPAEWGGVGARDHLPCSFLAPPKL